MARSKYEIKAQKELEAKGWLVDNKSGMGRWAKNRDYFHLFDLLSLDPMGRRIHLISIKGKAGIPLEHRKAIEEFPSGGYFKEIWYWKGKRGWSKKLIK